MLFERRTAENEPAHLYTVAIGGADVNELTPGTADDPEARFSSDGPIVFVRTSPPAAGVNADLSRSGRTAPA